PFTQGESHRAISIFPPTAFTIQGALRTLYISERGEWKSYLGGQDTNLNLAIGTPRTNELGEFRMEGPYVVRKDNYTHKYERFFPLPADVVKQKRGDNMRVLVPVNDLVTASISNTPRALYMLDYREDEEEIEDSYWISET